MKKGYVIFQSVRAGAEVPKGTAVSLQVSLGSSNPQPSVGDDPIESDDPIETDDPIVSDDPIESQDPAVSQEPDPSTPPTEADTPVTGVTKDISFNLSNYVGTVHLRVEVGDLLGMDGKVDTGIGSWTGTVSHSGTQTVKYYVDNVLVKSETVIFRAP